MKKFIIQIVSFLISSAIAQNTFVPDTNLRKVLKADFSSYLDTNDYIIDAKAASYSSYLNCSVQNIKDLTGLWKFTGITSLVCQNNAITNIDSLPKLQNLANLFCFHNKITHLPYLGTLNKLTYLSCGINEISKFPDLSQNTPLTYLDCGQNHIKELKGLDKLANLQTLYIYANELDTIPNLSKLSKLQLLMCHDNRLKAIPGLGDLKQLTQLIAGNNPLDSLPDLGNLSKMTNLKLYNCNLETAPNLNKMTALAQLNLNNNNLTTAPYLQMTSSLTSLELSNNQLATVPDITNSASKLKILKLDQNKLESLFDITSFTSLDTLYIQNNKLTFEDILPITHITTIKNLKYSPQDTIDNPTNVTGIERQRTIITLGGVDKNIKSNQYTWYKNGSWYATTATDTLVINQTQLSDSGTYTCVVNNLSASDLTLSTHPISLKVKPCIDLDHIILSTTDFDCNFGGSIKIDANSISGGTKPYTYQIMSMESGISKFNDIPHFVHLFENGYAFIAKDAKGCKATLRNQITLKGKKDIECKRLVILGDESSNNNNIYLEEKGSALIYDSEGQLVKTIITPAYWDGKNNNGMFIPGYYVVELNGKSMNVTLIK